MAAEKISSRSIGIPYGFLIDIYHKYHDDGDSQVINEIKRVYPSVYIGRNDRFIKTIQRIVSPTIPSIKGKVSISEGQALDRYREKIWIPRIRNLSK